MRHPEFPLASFIAIPLLLSSLPSHIRARSVCTVALIAWLTILNIIRGVNSLIWANNTVIRLEVWCDITTKILIGFTFAVPLSMLCVCRHLENVSSSRQAVITEADKRRRMKFEAVMCFGLPIIFMALHYVVQGHRFDLIEDIGCSPNTYSSVAGLFVVWIPPLIISTISFVYAVAAFHHFLQRRIEFAAVLRSSNAAMSPGRYFRLMALAVAEIMWDSGTNIYILWFNINFVGLRPWISWADVHSNFSRVGVFPEFALPQVFVTQVIWQWWIVPLSSFMVFMFFGFGEEAMADYRGTIIWFRRTVLRQNVKPGSSGTISLLPTSRHQPGQDANLSLPTDAASELETKGWDELSLKMPEIMTHVPLPSSTGVGLGTRCGSGIVEEQSLEKDPAFALKRSRSLSLDSERSMSIDMSESSSTMGRSTPPPLSHSQAPHNLQNHPSCAPTVTITDPEGTPTPSAVPRRVPSPTISRPTSYRRSTSTDLGITVSQAYLPDADTASRYHEETLLTPTTFGDGPPSHPELGYPHRLGGIHMTVEKRVF